MSPSPLDRAALLNTLPPPWPGPLREQIRARVEASGRTLVVLDDDPTGTQTVHNVPVLTEWSVAALEAELARGEPLFFILTNSRALPLPAAQRLNREIGQALVTASRTTGRDVVVVSRGDSTLRGHWPGETDALAEALGGGFDGQLLVPAFFEGGRYTIGDEQYVAEGAQLVPASVTPFAQDAAFGYRSSNLREWVAEKSGGAIAASEVAAISLQEIREGGPERVAARLSTLTDFAPCIVNAAAPRDLEVLTLGLLDAEAAGKRFLYRTAASFVQVRAGLAPRPLLGAAELELPTGGGLVIVGSYVPKTTRQLAALRGRTAIFRVELDVRTLLDDAQRSTEIARAAQQVEQALGRRRDVLLFTSRGLIRADDGAQSLSIGQRVSDALVEIVRGIQLRPRYLLAKGGITSSDIATRGLDVRRALVAGQLLSGVPVWRLGDESRFPGLAYIVFPGNVGGDDALATVVAQLQE